MSLECLISFCMSCHLPYLGLLHVIAHMYHIGIEQWFAFVKPCGARLATFVTSSYLYLILYLAHVFCFHNVGHNQWRFIGLHYLQVILSIFWINRISRLRSLDEFSKIQDLFQKSHLAVYDLSLLGPYTYYYAFEFLVHVWWMGA